MHYCLWNTPFKSGKLLPPLCSLLTTFMIIVSLRGSWFILKSLFSLILSFAFSIISMKNHCSLQFNLANKESLYIHSGRTIKCQTSRVNQWKWMSIKVILRMCMVILLERQHLHKRVQVVLELRRMMLYQIYLMWDLFFFNDQIRFVSLMSSAVTLVIDVLMFFKTRSKLGHWDTY